MFDIEKGYNADAMKNCLELARSFSSQDTNLDDKDLNQFKQSLNIVIECSTASCHSCYDFLADAEDMLRNEDEAVSLSLALTAQKHAQLYLSGFKVSHEAAKIVLGRYILRYGIDNFPEFAQELPGLVDDMKESCRVACKLLYKCSKLVNTCMEIISSKDEPEDILMLPFF